jgi:uncharacterized protein YkwD
MHTRIRDVALRAAFCAAIVLAFVTSGLAFEAPMMLEAAGCNADETIDAEEQAFLKLINQHRAANGRAPLGLSYTLSRAAAWKSYDLGVNRYFAHDDLDRSWSQRIRDCGYRYNTYLGENIAAGVSSAQSAFDLWRNSSGHNANMLGANYTTIGIGRAYVAGSPYGWYWTTEFGGIDDGYATIGGPQPLEPLPQPADQDEDADRTPPSLSLSARAHGKTVSIIARARDRDGIARVEFWSDGILLKSDTRAPYSVLVPTRRSVTVEARAYDRAGNVATKTIIALPTRR